MPKSQPQSTLSYKEQLKAKNAELQEVRKEVSVANEKVMNLGSDIKALEARIAEVQNATSGYGQLANEFADASKQLDQKISMAEAALKDSKDAIDKAVAAFDADLAEQKKLVTKAWEAAKSAPAESLQAEDDAGSKKDKVAGLTATRALRDELKDLKKALTDAAATESKGDYVVTYLILTDAKTRIPAPATSVSDLEKSIIQAQADAEAAKVTAVAKKKVADDALADYQTRTKAYDATVQARLNTLIKQLKSPQTPT